MATITASQSSFHAPPANIDLYIENRRIYYRSNMEFVTGILDTTHGGTGNSTFEEDRVVIYSGGKLISSGVTEKELASLKGLTVEKDDGTTISMTDLLNTKVSGIRTADTVLLDKDEVTNEVTLPDYLLKTGGTVSGDLEITKALKVGNVAISYDNATQCIAFNVV